MTPHYASLPALLRRLYSLLPTGHKSKPTRTVRWKPEKKKPGSSHGSQQPL